MARIEVGNKCPITGEPIVEVFPDFRTTGYRIEYNEDTRVVFKICSGCQGKIFSNDLTGEFNAYMKKNRGLLIGHLIHTDFEELNFKRLHFESETKEFEDKNDVDLHHFIENLKTQDKYPIHRKEKAENILRTFYQLQEFEGDKIYIDRTMAFWGKLFVQNFKELTFFLREFERNELITILKNDQDEFEYLQFTFKGLEQIEVKELDKPNLKMEDVVKEYDIALSFAGEQREYVEQVATELNNLGIKTFYDNFEQIDLWGKDLYQHLNDIYKNKCLYCIIFISKEYAEKLWTKHELSSAQTRAFKENREYILPTRFDDTELPGLNETIGYINLNEISPTELALMASKKINKES